jgi:hypothetical protein
MVARARRPKTFRTQGGSFVSGCRAFFVQFVSSGEPRYGKSCLPSAINAVR